MEINIVAVVIAGVLSMVLGFLWYGPMLFANAWMKEIGLTPEKIGSGPGIGYALTFVAALVSAAVTSLLVHRLGITKVEDGAFFGVLVAVGYMGTTFASNYIFGQKSMKLYLIDAGYQFFNILIAALVATLIR